MLTKVTYSMITGAFANVLDYGADNTGLTNSSAAIQAAVDALASGGVLYFPPGKYEMRGINIDGPAENKTENALTIFAPAGSMLKNTVNVDGTSMFIISSTLPTNWLTVDVSSIEVGLGGGHVFDLQGSVNHCQFKVDYVRQSEPTKSIVSCVDKYFFFNRVAGLFWAISTSHTVPALSFSTTSNKISANEFDILRPDRSGTRHFMELLSTSASDYNYSNRISLRNPEACQGGVLKLQRAFNTIVDQMHCFDMGAIANHVIEVGTTGYLCQNTKIRDYQRNSGTLASGKADVFIGDANYTYIEAISGVSSLTKVLIDLNNEPNTVLSGAAWYTVQNAAPDFNLLLTADEGVSTPKLVLTPQSARLTISSGAITVTDSVHAVDTEGGAATDDLDTINGGSDGYVLILRSFADARDVTLKDATGNLFLAGDFTLSNRKDTISLCYDAGLVGWVELSRSDNET